MRWGHMVESSVCAGCRQIPNNERHIPMTRKKLPRFDKKPPPLNGWEEVKAEIASRNHIEIGDDEMDAWETESTPKTKKQAFRLKDFDTVESKPVTPESIEMDDEEWETESTPKPKKQTFRLKDFDTDIE